MTPYRMGSYGIWTSLAGMILLPAILAQHASSAQSTPAQARVAIAHSLPEMDGHHLKVSVVEVIYAPGGSSQPHSHPCPVIGYIAEGAIRYQVKGETETVYKAGETFYEAPNGVHQVSANASDKEPAKLIAYFLCDHETPLSVAAPETQTGGK